MSNKSISIAGITLANDQPFVLFGGLNVLESLELTLEVADHFKSVAAALDIPLVFKASFDKANRSSLDSFRGPGLEQGLAVLADIRSDYGIPVLADVHETGQV